MTEQVRSGDQPQHPTPSEFRFENTTTPAAERGEGALAVVRPFCGPTVEVTLANSDDGPHRVLLIDDERTGTYHGWCSCAAYDDEPGPCAHLWAVHYGERRAALDVPTVEEILGGLPECPTCGTGFARDETPEVPQA